MWFDEPTAFLDSIKPIVYFNSLVGMGPHCRPPNISGTVYLGMKAYTVIFSIFNWTMIYIGFIVAESGDEYRELLMTPVLKMYYVVVCANSFMAVISPLLVWFQSKVLQDCFRQIPILDDTFQDIFGARNGYRKQYIRLTWNVIAIVLVVSLTSFLDTRDMSLDADSLWQMLASLFAMHHPILVVLLLDLNFCTFVGYLRKKFQDMNDGLLALTKKPSTSDSRKKTSVISRRVSKVTASSRINDTKAQSLITDNHVHLLHEVRKVHLDLCKLSRKMNAAFGIQNLLSIGISFGIVTGTLYNTYSGFMITDELEATIVIDMGSAFMWIMIYAFKIWIINHSCQIVSNEANRSGDVIYELLETRVDKEFQKEIQEFAVQMLQNPVRFNACGFFTLDYTLVQGVIGSITTYLVILIQMNQAPASPTSNTARVSNGTMILPNTSFYSEVVSQN